MMVAIGFTINPFTSTQTCMVYYQPPPPPPLRLLFIIINSCQYNLLTICFHTQNANLLAEYIKMNAPVQFHCMRSRGGKNTTKCHTILYWDVHGACSFMSARLIQVWKIFQSCTFLSLDCILSLSLSLSLSFFSHLLLMQWNETAAYISTQFVSYHFVFESA